MAFLKNYMTFGEVETFLPIYFSEDFTIGTKSNLTYEHFEELAKTGEAQVNGKSYRKITRANGLELNLSASLHSIICIDIDGFTIT